MNSRDAILQRIRTALANGTAGATGVRASGGLPATAQQPPVGEVWPRTNPTAEELVERFTRELAAVDGEVIRCGSIGEARRRLGELIEQAQWERIGAVDRPACRELLSELGSEQVAWTRAGWPPPQIAELPAGLIPAEWLLADSGSCVVVCDTPEERLMCYLPPVCVVIARADRLFEHMPAAWPQIARHVAEPPRRGETVIVTGPSRTADIEKILILGVHGPRRVVVVLV
jgi:L-lactate dehydrogenase complex protein LldG